MAKQPKTTTTKEDALHALELERQQRLDEFVKIVQEAGARLNCTLIAKVEIFGNQVRGTVVPAVK